MNLKIYNFIFHIHLRFLKTAIFSCILHLTTLNISVTVNLENNVDKTCLPSKMSQEQIYNFMLNHPAKF